MSLNYVNQLSKGQLAYRDTDGNIMILDMSEEKLRESFIQRLTTEYIEERDEKDLLDRFKQSYKEARNGQTKKTDREASE